MDDVQLLDNAGGAEVDSATEPVETGTPEPENGATAADEVVETPAGEGQQSEGVEGEEPSAQQEQVESEPVEQGDFADITPDALNKALAENPQFKAALDANPDLRNSLFRMSRLAQESLPYRELFPTVEDAQYANEQAQALNAFDELFYSDAPQSAQQLLQELYANQFERDPETGDYRRDESGNLVSTGAYERLTTTYREMFFGALADHAKQAGDKELSNAIDLIQLRMNGGKSQAQPTEQKADLPPGVQDRLRRLDELERQQSTSQQQAQWQFYSTFAESVDKGVRGDVEQYVTNSNLPPYVREKVVDDIMTELNKLAGQNANYQNRVKSMMRARQTDKAVAAARNLAKESLPSVGQRILDKVTKDLKGEAEQRQAKLRQQQTRREPKTTGSAPAPVRQADGDRIRATEQKLGRRLTDREILDL